IPSGLGDRPDPRRFWYGPSAPEGKPVFTEIMPGRPLDVDAIVAALPVPTERPLRTAAIDGALTLDRALAAWPPDAWLYECSPAGRRAEVECPWAGEHSDGRRDAMVFDREGVLGFKCLHAHCAGRDWHAFRSHYEPDHHPPTPILDPSVDIFGDTTP